MTTSQIVRLSNKKRQAKKKNKKKIHKINSSCTVQLWKGVLLHVLFMYSIIHRTNAETQIYHEKKVNERVGKSKKKKKLSFSFWLCAGMKGSGRFIYLI